MLCHQCQFDNEVGNAFCQNCGTALVEPDKATTHTNSPLLTLKRPFRHRVMEIMNGSPNQPLSRYAEWLISLVVVINCAAVILDSVPEVHADYKDFFHELEFWSVIFFTSEYLLRVWSFSERYLESAWRGRKEYVFSIFGLVDFFATVPFYLHYFIPGLDLRILRVLRLLRILKLSKYNSALQDLYTAVYSERRAFGSAAFLLMIAAIVSASMMHFAEGHAQPNYFGTIPHSIYWSIVTITSGWGNVEPATKMGEVIALFTGFLGVCMVAIMTGIVASAFANQAARKKAAYEAQMRQVLKDGVVTEKEGEVLQRLQEKFRLSDAEVETMMKQAQAKGRS